jgi:predicted molibdopterin-dependent oxidoreductase YjgC
VILPDVSSAEKKGTFTNTERRVQLVNRAIEPVGQARPDWQIISELGRRLGPGWDYESTAQVIAEIAGLAPIYAGITHERLERGERLQWPVESAEHCGTPILPLGLLSGGEVHWSVVDTIG